MPRIKPTNVTFKTRSEFDQCIDEIATLQLKIDATVASHNEAKAAADKVFKTTLKRRKERLAQKLAASELYASFHRDEVLGDKQSSETKLAHFGYRKSPGILTKLNSKWSVAKTIEALKAAGKTACLKVTTSLNKNTVKTEIPEADLSKFGLRMDYPEEFWIEAKRSAEPTGKRLKP